LLGDDLGYLGYTLVGVSVNFKNPFSEYKIHGIRTLNQFTCSISLPTYICSSIINPKYDTKLWFHDLFFPTTWKEIIKQFKNKKNDGIV
jgi:hypothetical protein